MLDNEQNTGAPTEEEVLGALESGSDDNEFQEELKALSPEQRTAVTKILIKLTASANRAADARKSKELADVVATINAKNEVLMTEYREQIRKSMTPPTPDEISKLLEQEYVEFPLQIGQNGSKREFVIRELPLKAESRILKTIQKAAKEYSPMLKDLNWNGTQTPVERMQQILSIVPDAIEKFGDCCAVCLDPLGDNADIDGNWVTSHLSSYRVIAILDAQLTAGRYRDFFSLAYRLFQTARTM